MVPGSTLMYGSSLMLVTRMPRDSRIAAREAAAMPFPREETTPPVTKTYLVIYLGRVGMWEFTRDCHAAQTHSTQADSRFPRGAGCKIAYSAASSETPDEMSLDCACVRA